MLSATITIPSQARIEASGGGTFAYNPSGTGAAELDCGLKITPSGGSGVPLGNRTQEDFSGAVAYKEPGSAGGALLSPAGTYTVALQCHQLVSSASLSFVRGDLNVAAFSP